MTKRVLYLTYDGLTDPLGQSQVLPYLKGLAAKGHRISVISCEKPDAMAARGKVIASECADADIKWFPHAYRKSPRILSTLIDLHAMRRTAIHLHQADAFEIVHCRSYLTALVGRSMQRRFGTKFLFDMRGFWIDERFERGIWKKSNLLYRAIAFWLRGREGDLFASADAIVSLTHAARGELEKHGGATWGAKITVIPCCVDLDHFNPRDGTARREGRRLLGLDPDIPLLLFLGSLGGAYPLAPVIQFFRAWSDGRDDAMLLFITRHPPSEILAHPDATELESRIKIRAGERWEMPNLVAAADAGVSFILPSRCAVASSPTKVGEMLAMGIPIAVNDGVGDMALVMSEPGAGILLDGLDSVSIEASAAAFRNQVFAPTAARTVAMRWFSLDQGLDSYDRLYASMGTI